MKVIDLLNRIAKGENPTFKKDGGTYKDSVFSFINMYFGNKIMTHEEIVDWLNSEIQIIKGNDEVQERAREYDNKRAELRQEYNRLVEQGKIRKPTQYEQALKKSKGDPNRSDVQAAKRLVEKYRQRMKNKR